jgi:ATP-dependent DNA helicase RecG
VLKKMSNRYFKGKNPGQLIAYAAEADAVALAETLVAFANADGGTLFLGITPEGEIGGISDEEVVEGLLRQAEALCRPPVQARWQQEQVEERTVMVVSIPRSPELHSLEDGRVLVRAGVENRPLGGEAIRQLAATKSSGDFETEPVPGTTRRDLDEEVIAGYLEKRAERQRRPITAPVDEVLQEAGALADSGQPTVAGLLLFGQRPQAFLPQGGLVFVRFVGTDPRGPGGLPGYGRRETVEGPLPRLIEAAWDIIWEEMRVEAVVRNLVREERPEYPPFAVREALVNAICHRDYRLTGRRIEVRMFDDRLEVFSPGGLPGYITLDNLIEEHFSRNPRIVAGLFQWGFIEELGLGIDRMIEAMLEAGQPAPNFKATSYSFTVTLRNLRERPTIPAWQHSMNERQMRALAHIQAEGRITNREYRELCPDVSGETLRLDLADLVDKGILLKVGAKRGTYYILK